METDNNHVSELKSAPILIGKWTFYPDILQLECADKNIKLEPRTASLLFHLTQNAGNPVSRDILIEKTWPGVVVGDEALTSAINKLRNAFGDDSHNPEVIDTIPKVGYRLIADVKFLTSENVTSDTNSSFKSLNITSISAVIGFAILLGLLFWFQRPELADQQIPTLPNKPSIAVLPFINLSSDSEQEYFSDGISESIIADLSKLKSITVIARNSSFSYKDKALGIQEIGRNLGAQFILEGSVQKSGDRLRIITQLVDAKTGHQLWADQFDRRLTDIFLLQDEITDKIISTLSIRLSADEQKHLGGNVPTSFEAYDLFLRGQRVSVDFSEEAITQAVELYRQAIRLDPNYAHAYGALAVARIRQFLIGYTDTPARTKDRALELARKAAALDPGSHQIQWSLGYVHMYRKEFDEALEASERAVLFSPNYADGYALLALIKNNLGEAEEVMPLLEKAMLLNPHYTWDYIYQLGRAYYALGEYKKAVSYLRQALERNESAGYPRLFLAASYVNLGQVDEAEWEITQVQMAHPEYSYAHLQKTAPIGNQKLLDRFFNDLRSAGLTE